MQILFNGGNVYDIVGDIPDPAAFAKLVRSFFLHRRKTMAHNARLIEHDPPLTDAIAAAGIDGGVRPEDLSVDEWVRLFQAASRR